MAAAHRLQALNSNLVLEVVDKYFSVENALELLVGVDVVVDGSDNFETRYLVNDACVLTNKPFVYGSIFKFEGQVSVFNLNDGPTYRCMFPSPPKPGEMPNCSEVGVMGVLPGIIGALQANEVVKIICGIGEVLSGKMYLFNALDLSSNIVEIPVVSENKVVDGLSHLELDCNFNGVVNQMEAKEFYFIKKGEWEVIDVRNRDEYNRENLGAKLIPLPEIEKRFNEISTDKKVLVHCQSGRRSERAIAVLKEKLPHTEFYNLKGGIEAVLKTQ